jgi:hypothetical protein
MFTGDGTGNQMICKTFMEIRDRQSECDFIVCFGTSFNRRSMFVKVSQLKKGKNIMKTRKPNSVVVKGDLFGGEIEPGTFHVHNLANSSDDRTMPASDETVRNDAESVMGSVSAPETDIAF